MGRREEKKADKRERLLAAGLRAFREEGYATASVERIAAEAGVARGTFYLYFRDKEALLDTLVLQLFEPLGVALAEARVALASCADVPSTLPVYAALGEQLAEILLERAAEVRIWFAESRSPGSAGDLLRARAAAVEALTEDILRDAAERGVLRPHDTHAVALAIFGGIERLAGAFLAGDERLDPSRLPDEITAFFRYGLATTSAPAVD